MISPPSGETHTVPGTSYSYTLAADVALLTRNIKIIGVEYPDMMKESFGARLLVGTFSSEGIDYKGTSTISFWSIITVSWLVLSLFNCLQRNPMLQQLPS